MRSLILVLLIACSPGGGVDPSDVRAAAVRIDTALDRALDQARRGHPEAAREAWRDAHRTWHATVAPGMRRHLDPLDVVALELHLGRIRAALEGDPDRAVGVVETYRGALASPLAALPSAPGAG